MVAEAAGQPRHAGSHYLFAAWVLDEAGKDELAHAWRSKAADTFVALLSKEELFAKQLGAAELFIVTECLRRAGRWTEALQVIERGLSESNEDFIHKILAWQRVLIQRRDT